MYREPGARITLVQNQPKISGNDIQMIPMLIGTTCQYVTSYETMIRGNSDTDLIPVNMITSINEIVSIGFSPNKSNFVGSGQDYTLTLDNLDEVQSTKSLLKMKTGSNIITVSNITDISANNPVSGTGVPDDTLVSSVGTVKVITSMAIASALVKLANIDNVVIGNQISGDGIQSGTSIIAVSDLVSATTTNGSADITIAEADVVLIAIGDLVTGSGIPAATTITAIGEAVDGDVIVTLNNPATASATVDITIVNNVTLSKTATANRSSGNITFVNHVVLSKNATADGSSGNIVFTRYIPSADVIVTITWTNNGKLKISSGSKFYVTYKKSVDDIDGWFQPKLVSQSDNIQSIVGPFMRDYDTFTNETDEQKINNLAFSTYLALLNGAPQVYVLPVPITGNDALSVKYDAALSEYGDFILDAWRMVPVDQTAVDRTTDNSAAINSIVDKHVRYLSSPDERNYRTAIYGYKFAAEPTSFDSSFDDLKAYASSKASSRISVVYPGRVNANVPGIGDVEVGAQFLCAAYAGLEASKPGYNSKTRSTIIGITSLAGIIGKLSRNDLNELADAGIMIFYQPSGATSAITIRHQLTTDMSDVQHREASIQQIIDYVQRRYLATSNNYIGKFNISEDLITRLNGSLISDNTKMSSAGWITSGTIKDISQDADNPDSLIVDANISVPYPCNNIDLTLFVE